MCIFLANTPWVCLSWVFTETGSLSSAPVLLIFFSSHTHPLRSQHIAFISTALFFLTQPFLSRVSLYCLIHCDFWERVFVRTSACFVSSIGDVLIVKLVTVGHCHTVLGHNRLCWLTWLCQKEKPAPSVCRYSRYTSLCLWRLSCAKLQVCIVCRFVLKN